MTVTDKRNDIAILRTLGASPRTVMGIFITQGLVIGWVGVALGVTLGVQNYVVFRRALPLWAELGPDAGRPLRVQFTQFTQSPAAFFASFNTPPGWTAGQAQGHGAASQRDDPNIIDAEVVEDDDDHGPPELHAPR